MESGSFLFEELPSDARGILDEAQTAIREFEEKAQREIQEIRLHAERRIAEIRATSNGAIQAKKQKLAEQLKPLQISYAKQGLLDEALAIRERIQRLRIDLAEVQQDPGTLNHLKPEDAGKTIVYQATGSASGPIWGTDVYTSDSRLATAAVHAGALGVAEKGLLKVTVVDTGQYTKFEGTARNGVQSHSWGPYRVGYRLVRAR